MIELFVGTTLRTGILSLVALTGMFSYYDGTGGDLGLCLTSVAISAILIETLVMAVTYRKGTK